MGFIFYKTILYYNIAYMMCTNQEKNCFEVLTGISVLESPQLSKGFFCEMYTFMYVYLAVCSATDYWIDFHPTRNRHTTVWPFRPQHKMVRRVSEAAGRTMVEKVSRDWVSMRFVSICISVTIVNSFITKWVRKRKLVSVPDTVCLFLLVPPLMRC